LMVFRYHKAPTFTG